MRKELMQEVARYGRLGRLRLDNLKGQSVTIRWRDRLVVRNVNTKRFVELTPGG